MFSLIITIISIALVAALAIASIYYGGEAFGRGSTQAAASTVVNQAQQILGAADIYRATNAKPAEDISDLVSEFLQSAPTVPANIAGTETETGTWTFNDGLAELTNVNPDVCEKIDDDYGDDGIYRCTGGTFSAGNQTSTSEGSEG